MIVLCEELVIMFIAWEGGEAEQLSNRLLSTMSAFSLIQFNMGTAENYFIIYLYENIISALADSDSM